MCWFAFQLDHAWWRHGLSQMDAVLAHVIHDCSTGCGRNFNELRSSDFFSGEMQGGFDDVCQTDRSPSPAICEVLAR